MTTIQQVEANRHNAIGSTGPRTPDGKVTASLNAVTHGLLSRQTLLTSENAEELENLADALRAELKPVGAVESLLVDRIIAATWRLRRLVTVEAGIFTNEMGDSAFNVFGKMHEGESFKPTLGLAFIRDGNDGDSFSRLNRYEAGIERSWYRALHELRRLQAVRAGAIVPPPVAVDIILEGAGQAA